MTMKRLKYIGIKKSMREIIREYEANRSHTREKQYQPSRLISDRQRQGDRECYPQLSQTTRPEMANHPS